MVDTYRFQAPRHLLPLEIHSISIGCAVPVIFIHRIETKESNLYCKSNRGFRMGFGARLPRGDFRSRALFHPGLHLD